jgi:hypothetical protein
MDAAQVNNPYADRAAFAKMSNYPLVRQSDMSDETRAEAIDICSTGAQPRARRARHSHTPLREPLASLAAALPAQLHLAAPAAGRCQDNLARASAQPPCCAAAAAPSRRR